MITKSQFEYNRNEFRHEWDEEDIECVKIRARFVQGSNILT